MPTCAACWRPLRTNDPIPPRGADAEQWFKEREDEEYTVCWEDDAGGECSGDGQPPHRLLCCIMSRWNDDAEDWEVVAAMGGIGDPDRNYRRLIEAQLALEVIYADKGKVCP